MAESTKSRTPPILDTLRSLNRGLDHAKDHLLGPLYDKLGTLVVEFYKTVEPLGHSVTYKDCHKPIRREIRLFAKQLGLADEDWVTGAVFKLLQDEKVARSRRKHAKQAQTAQPTADPSAGTWNSGLVAAELKGDEDDGTQSD